MLNTPTANFKHAVEQETFTKLTPP